MFSKCSLFVVMILAFVLAACAQSNTCCPPQLAVANRRVENKRFHVVINYKANFYIAVENCRYIGMDLASIETQAQQTALYNYITSLGLAAERFWISGSDLGHEGRFVWLNTGLPLNFTNFMANQPSNAGGNENCLEIKDAGRWNDDNCNRRNYFVCQF